MSEDLPSPSKRDGISPTGWWVVGLLARESADKSKHWINYRLYRAPDWRSAYEKAAAAGEREGEIGHEAFSGPCSYIGIADLIPLYDPIEEGGEIFFEEFGALDVPEEQAVRSIEEMSKFFEPE